MSIESLSLCMIVKNEERVLGRCLDSVASLAAELVIVDTGSTDATPRIAASYGAKVAAFDFSFVDFAGARNFGLERATGRWILALDADETLYPGGEFFIKQLVAQDANAGYYFERLNRGDSGRRPATDRVVRLFPNRPAYRYRGRVHETIDASIIAGGGRLLSTKIRIGHDFASDPEARRQRNLRYIGILNEEIAADPTDYSRLDFLAAEYHQLGMLGKAAEIADRIACLKPLDPEAHLRAGVYHLLYTSDLESARARLLEALRLRPGYAEAQSFLERLEARQPESQTGTQSHSDGIPDREGKGNELKQLD